MISTPDGPPNKAPHTWSRFVAVGDSFTEGLEDPGTDGRHRGWADQLAEQLGAINPDFHYANLAIRGRRVPAIVSEQVPAAIALEPDLLSIAAGVNDAMRTSWDLPATAELMEDAVRDAKAHGTDVLLVSFGNPSRRSASLRTITRRLAEYREILLAIAHDQQCYMLDFWPETAFDDPRFWAEDRLHLNASGHERAAAAALEVLGLGDGSWRAPLEPTDPLSRAQALRGHARWTGKHLAPWIGRRVTGRSSGDDVDPKRPTFEPM